MTASSLVSPALLQGPGIGDPQNEVYNRLLRNRIVFLGTDVNDNVANLLIAQLLYL
ncbi:MAG: ATP-dependent Clp protease proteolytic subunit, partial [Acidimicrobiia bacterium]|nr:ATP-dependent Clp protease proteolytic subunit [Acidimicrobiia bacterium]